MPEACFLCLDSTEYMRNGDQFPNRLMAEQEAANLLVNAKTQMNAENTVGFLTTGGAACTVFETLTADVDNVMATLTKIPISGKRCHFGSGLLIASLALSHRTNPRAEKRIVAFVGSPVEETEQELEVLAKRLRKDDVAVDVVSFGVAANTPLLEGFVNKVSKGGNSRLLTVPPSGYLTDVLMESPILRGSDFVPDGEGGAPPAGSGFGVDPNADPELALALRLSMEEELQRQAAAAGATGGSEEPSSPAAPTPQAPAEELDFENMSEEEMLQRALAMSLEESNQPTSGGNEEEGSGGGAVK